MRQLALGLMCLAAAGCQTTWDGGPKVLPADFILDYTQEEDAWAERNKQAVQPEPITRTGRTWVEGIRDGFRQMGEDFHRLFTNSYFDDTVISH